LSNASSSTVHADAFGSLRRSELIVRRDVELLHQLQERDGRNRLRHAGDLDVGLVGEQNVRVEERICAKPPCPTAAGLPATLMARP